jgi:hypothetical protein
MAVRKFLRLNWQVVTIVVTAGAIVCAAVFLLSTMPPRSCSPVPLVRRLGAARVLIDVAEALEALGWRCELLQPSDLGINLDQPGARWLIGPRLRDRLFFT